MVGLGGTPKRRIRGPQQAAASGGERGVRCRLQAVGDSTFTFSKQAGRGVGGGGGHVAVDGDGARSVGRVCGTAQVSYPTATLTEALESGGGAVSPGSVLPVIMSAPVVTATIARKRADVPTVACNAGEGRRTHRADGMGQRAWGRTEKGRHAVFRASYRDPHALSVSCRRPFSFLFFFFP